MTSNHPEEVSTEVQLLLDELHVNCKLHLERIEKLEKDMSRFRFTLLASIFALQTVFPNGLNSIIDLLQKI